MKNIAVLEISNGHAEILYSQTLFAKKLIIIYIYFVTQHTKSG